MWKSLYVQPSCVWVLNLFSSCFRGSITSQKLQDFRKHRPFFMSTGYMMNAAAASEKWKRVWFILRPPHASSFCTVSGRRGCDGYLWGDVWSDWRPARGSDNHSAGPGHLWTSTCFHRLRLNQRRRRPAKSKRLKFYYSQCSAAQQIIHSHLYLCYYCLFAPKQ